MFPTHGFKHDGLTLEYKDHAGYCDIIDSDDPFIRLVGECLVVAALTIARKSIVSFAELAPALDPPLPDFAVDDKDLFEMVTGTPFPDA